MLKVKNLLPTFHVIPHTGWMNDPNGLSWFKNEYHIFYQSCPDTTANGLKKWGHYTTKDFKKYKYQGIAINPDHVRDCNGVYSGSAIEFNGKLYLFYTGNVKREGNYDYILEGREGNTMRVESSDGINFTNKKVILTNQDYPSNLSCHVRDPKIYKEKDTFYMILGARTKNDLASYIIYKSKDLENFTFVEQKIFNDLGYMLECPDVFFLNNKKIFSFSPQGVKAEANRFKNIFSSGYSINEVSKDNYHEWDLGYDFYAPQTFTDPNNRQILFGWAGLDGAEYTYPTDDEGWKHCLTLPRELKLIGNKVYQYPVKEIFELFDEYKNENEFEGREFACSFSVSDKVSAIISDSIIFTFEKNRLSCEFINNPYGRKDRSYDIDIFKCLIIYDNSVCEIYINDGEYVFTTRVFSQNHNIKVSSMDAKICKIRSAIYE